MNRDYRWRWVLLIVAVALFISQASCVPHSSVDQGYVERGDEDDSAIFYDALAPYGRWVNHGTYGRVWYPHDVAMGWRPYSDGHWEYSPDYGWVWASDREWGWAPFHYGRWAFDDWYGWVWVPGREWAPAWVVWRYGGGYAAWAPMPPTAFWRPGQGVDRRYFRHDRDLDWDCWVGVPERHLHDREMHRHIISQQDNVTLIKRTTTVVSVAVAGGRVVNQGVPVRYLEKVTGRPVARVRLHEVDRPDARDGDRDRGVLQVVRPHFRQRSAADIRRETERAEALSWQQDRREQERRREGQPQGQLAPRKAGRFGDKSKDSEGRPPADQAAPLAPSSAKEKNDAGSTPRGRGQESRDQPVVLPLVREGQEVSIPDAVPPVAPWEGERRELSPPAWEQGTRPVRRGSKPAAPRSGPQGEVEGDQQLRGEQPGVAAPLLPGAPVPPVVPSPQQPAPPEVSNVPPPAFDAGEKPVPGRVPHPYLIAPLPAPAEVQGSAAGAAAPKILAPARLGHGPVQGDQRPGVVGDEAPAMIMEQIRGSVKQRDEHTPQQQVELPVVPTPPEAPSVRRPQLPVQREVLPPPEAESPRRGRVLGQRRRPDQQGAQEAEPVMGEGQQVERQGQPSGGEVRPDGRGKRKKKIGQPEEEESVEQEGDLQGQPLP